MVMTQAEQLQMQLLILKGTLSDKPQEFQLKVHGNMQRIQAILDEDNDAGFMSLAMLTCMAGIKQSEKTSNQ